MASHRIKLVEATVVDARRLELRFSDGSEGIADLGDLMAEPPDGDGQPTGSNDGA